MQETSVPNSSHDAMWTPGKMEEIKLK
jgi:hypothetical protein